MKNTRRTVLPDSETNSISEVTAVFGREEFFIKLFPAGSMGPEYLKALHDGPMGHILYIAASGVSIENIADYMAAGACGAGISSGIVKKEWIDTGKFEKITELAQQFISNANAG